MNLTDGEYKATVYGTINNYFENSDIISSTTAKYEALFSNTSTPSAYVSTRLMGTGASADTITGFRMSISNLSYVGFKPGVSYSFQRATVDADGNTGTYAAVTLKKYDTGTGNYVNLSATDLTPDILGNVPVQTYNVYDEITSPANLATYRYRIAATKDSKTEYRTISNTVTLNYRNYIDGDLSVGAKTTSGTNSRYSITPSITYKNALQTGDKLELYYVTGDSNAYQSGPYQKAAIEWTKAELEAGTAKNFDVPANAGSNRLSVQAYMVLADGTQVNLSTSSNFSWDYYGSSGITNYDTYYDSSYNSIYCMRLDY